MIINKSRITHRLALIILCLIVCFSCVRTVSYNHDNGVGSNYYQTYPNNYQRYNKPQSRSYKNPYNKAPANYYPYYDYDYYYVPPSNYRNIEPAVDNSGPDNTKF